jgi:flagellin
MGINSVNTNFGALAALQSLNRTNEHLNQIQKRVTTGYRVNDAVDDGAAFAVAQGVRGNIAAIGAVNQQLNIARGTNSTALEAATSISNTLIKIRETATKLADSNLSTSQRAQYNQDLSRLVGEINNFVSNAAFNGTNLLRSGTPVTVIANVSGNQFTLTSFDFSAYVAENLTTNIVSANAGATFLSGGFASAETLVSTALNAMGGDARRLNNQVNFNAALLKASEEALGYIVDADLAKESARLQSFQIRQQLGTQTLGIANQNPQSLLGLFR